MDWIAFLTDNSIDYVTSGPNTKHGEASIKCPWCGDDDPSHHLGISLIKEAYGCLRHSGHVGKKPHKLIQALLGCSFNQAKLVAKQYSQSDPETLEQALAALTDEVEAPAKVQRLALLQFPKAFKVIERTGTTSKYWKYLKSRYFNPVDCLIEEYGLLCCNTGPWKDRIIIPLYLNNQLVTWTSRALQNPINAPRYMTLSEEDGALENINNLIFNEDELRQGDELLFVTEGPFDALKLDFYGKFIAARATCTFGTSMSLEQAGAIIEHAKQFRRTILLFDPEAVESTFKAHAVLESGGVEIGSLPDGIEDPGALTELDARKFIEEYLK